ncbi:helix-turn-helix transcriptional regulator [Pseudonocardia sp. RS010]|uniref:helix-turn-helix transcriptional regulator n=1 Tax=Pseudonocardia sp. RS010 TaxID=3385979 RepID=UPI0039A274AB
MTTDAAETRLPKWSLADRLRKVRRDEAQLGQTEFAAALGVGRQAYSSWEAGTAKPRDLITVAEKVSEVTGVPAWWILGLNTAPPAPEGTPAAGGADELATRRAATADKSS